jgi:hypothetical protein
MNLSSRALCACIFLCPRFVPANAQKPAAAEVLLSGAVLDPSSAAIPHATLHLHSNTLDRETRTDDTGRFTLSIPAGTYQMIVSAEGFRTIIREGVSVSNRNAILNVTLTVATEEEQVEVNSDAASRRRYRRCSATTRLPIAPSNFAVRSTSSS